MSLQAKPTMSQTVLQLPHEIALIEVRLHACHEEGFSSLMSVRVFLKHECGPRSEVH